jgi:hypothetical protein
MSIEIKTSSKRHRTTFTRQFRTLCIRNFRNAWRNPAVVGFQVVGYLSAAVFLGELAAL